MIASGFFDCEINGYAIFKLLRRHDHDALVEGP